MFETWLLDLLKKAGLVGVGTISPVLTYFGIKYLINRFSKNGNNAGVVKQSHCEARREKITELIRQENTKQDNRTDRIVENIDKNFQDMKFILGEIKGKVGG